MIALATDVWRKLRRDSALPAAALARKVARNAISHATARVYLGDCDDVGARVRTYRAPIVENRGRIRVEDAASIISTYAPVHLRTEPGGTISIGRGAIVSWGASLAAGRLVEIGPRALIAWRVVLHDHELGAPESARAIRIGEDAWIAGGARVLPGCSVGARSVVGAGSVVTEDVPDGVLVAGAPARVVRPLAGADAKTRALGEAPLGPGHPLAADLALPVARALRRATGAVWDGAPSAAHLAAAVRLRACDAVGADVFVDGVPLIENDGRIALGARVRVCSRPELTHLVTGALGEIRVGDDVSIGAGSGICAHSRISIGDGTVLGARCMLIDTDFHGLEDRSLRPMPRPISIGRNVRLGEGTIVLRGSVVGDGAVVEPGSVVTGRAVAPGARVAGVPARPV